MSQPAGPSTGKLININFYTLRRWFINRFVLGFVIKRWYEQILKEGNSVYVERHKAKVS